MPNEKRRAEADEVIASMSMQDVIREDEMRRTGMATAFYQNGLRIYVNSDDHSPPHIHVSRGTKDTPGFKMSRFRIDTLEMLPGDRRTELEDNDKRTAIEWAWGRQNELLGFWNSVMSGKSPEKIP